MFTGRSWDKINAYDKVSLAVCLMGDFNRFYSPMHQIDALFHLVDYGVSLKYISGTYKMIGHRQTKQTESPGEYLYKELKDWPPFDSCNNKNKSNICGNKDFGYTLDDWKNDEQKDRVVSL